MMALRINGDHPMFRLGPDVERFVSDVLDCVDPAAVLGRYCQAAFPPLTLWEDDGSVHVEVEVPGLKMDDLEVFVLDNELTIKGERMETERQGVSYHCREVRFGKFSRVVHLPVDVDAEKVQATLRDGLLTITLPKTPSVMPRKIQVKSAR